MRSLKWVMIGWKYPVTVWIRSQWEEQKSRVLSDQLNYRMLKGYYGMLAPWHQRYAAYHSFKHAVWHHEWRWNQSTETVEKHEVTLTWSYRCSAQLPSWQTPVQVASRSPFDLPANHDNTHWPQKSELIFPFRLMMKNWSSPGLESFASRRWEAESRSASGSHPSLKCFEAVRIRVSDLSQFKKRHRNMDMPALTWLVVLLIIGLGLYLRLGLWLQ